MKIVGSMILRDGETIQIELGDLPEDMKEFRFIWLQAEWLPDLAVMCEKL